MNKALAAYVLAAAVVLRMIDPSPVAAPEGWVVYEWVVRCPEPGGTQV